MSGIHKQARESFGLVAVVLLVGCGASTPTPELVDARRTYDQARAGQAAQLVPDKLLTAKQALDKAEQAHEDKAGSDQEKAYAYVAKRKALLAMSLAAIEAAKKQIADAQANYGETQDELRKKAEKSASQTAEALKDNKAQLDKVRQQLSQEGDKLSAAAQELKRKEAELAQRQKDLEKEKQARAEAEKTAAAALASLKEIGRVKEEQRGMVITLDGSVLFASGKSQLLPIAQVKLDKVAEVLQQQSDDKMITVEGHTDSVGSDDANMKLSQDRADSVRSYLVAKGVPTSRIKSVGKGETTPIGDNKTPEGRALNRRVEIIVK